MTWSQTFILGWLQFTGGGLVLLLLAWGSLRWIHQPVERLRLIQLALAAAVGLPVLLAVTPWPAWRIGVISPSNPEPTANDSPPQDVVAQREVRPPEAVPAFSPPAGRVDSDPAFEPRAASPQQSQKVDFPQSSGSLPPRSVRKQQIATTASSQDVLPTKMDFWTMAAVILIAVHSLAALFFLIEGAVGVLRLRRLVRSATEAGETIKEAWLAVTDSHGSHVRLLVSSKVETPLAFGWLHPVVIVPCELAEDSGSALRSCLAHEWSHIELGDLLTHRCAWGCQFLLWHQPLYWALWSELRICQDMLADAGSIRTGQDSIEYSELLVRFAKKRRARSLRGALPFLDRPSHLPRRITMLLKTKAPLRSRCPWRFSLGSMFLMALAAVVLSGIRLDATQAHDENPEGENRTTTVPSTNGKPAEQAPRAKQDDDQSPEDTQPAAALLREAPKVVAADEIAGLVIDEKGNPLSDVTIDAWHWHPGNETKSDEKGRFRLKGLDPKERVEVLITKEGYSPQHFAQRPTGAKGWVVVLGQKTYFEGTVVGADGKPVANADIRASFGPVQGDGVVISEVTTQGKSRDDGTYRLYVAPGVYDVQVSAGDRGVFRQSNVAIQHEQAKKLPVQLQPGVHFEAKVVDAITEKPVEGFVLWRWRSPRLIARSDAKGKIVIEGLVPGKFEFNCGGGEQIVHESGVKFFRHGPFGRWWSEAATNEWQKRKIDDPKSGWQRNFDDLEFDLHLGMEPVMIVVEQGVAVSGRVTDPKGQPVAGATVAPAKTGSGNSITGDTRYSVTTDKDGHYQVVLPASNQAVYNLVAHDGKYGQWRNWANGVSEPMKTTPGQTIANFPLRLTEPATVKGRVLLNGKGIGGRDVRTHAFDKRENRYYDPTTQTRDDGTFELKFIRPGKHYVQVEPFWLTAEDAPQGSKEVELKAGEVLEGIELQAAPQQKDVTPEISSLPFKARVLDAQKQPAANVPVALGALGGIKSYRGILEKQAVGLPESRTDEKGIAALNVSLLTQVRQTASLIYAVDSSSKQAGIALLKLSDYADALEAESVIDVTLEPAVEVKIEVRADAFQNLKVQPEGVQLAIMRDSLPLQYSGLAKPGSVDLLLPSGAYRVITYGSGVAETTEVEFKLDSESKKQHALEIELKPSRLAKLIGQPAPEFSSIKSSGESQPIRLEHLKGKVVVLDFWGTWCGPCIAAMPNLMSLYDDFHDRGVEVITIHDDSVETVEALRTTIAKLSEQHWKDRELPFPVLLDGGGETLIPESERKARGATMAAYGITAFPTTLVIDRQGRIEGQINLHDLQSARQRLEELLRQPGQ